MIWSDVVLTWHFFIKKKRVRLPELCEQLGSFMLQCPNLSTTVVGVFVEELGQKFMVALSKHSFFFFKFRIWKCHVSCKFSFQVFMKNQVCHREKHSTNTSKSNQRCGGQSSGGQPEIWAFSTMIYEIRFFSEYDIHRLNIAWNELLNSELFFFTSFCCLKSL